MTVLPPEADAALQPVRRALRSTAEQQAAEIRDAAAGQAATLLETARAEAAALLAAARAEGEATARAEAALGSARVRRQAHELVLARRNALRLELFRRVRASAAGLKADARYAALVERLTDQCHEALGPYATISESPEGGVIAEAGPRRLDLSLPVLAEMTLDSLPEVRELWTRQ